MGRTAKQLQNGEVHRYLVMLLIGTAVVLGLALRDSEPATSQSDAERSRILTAEVSR